MHAYILIDRSGSMLPKWDETIGAVNAYVAGLTGNALTAKTKVTVAVFDGAGTLQFDVVRSRVKAKEWKDILPTEVAPRGMTPLFDAIGAMCAMVTGDAPKTASIVILTDGAENASREFTKTSAASIIADFKKAKYDVVFIGAEFDAFGEANAIGVSAGQTLNLGKGGYGNFGATMAMRSVNYASMAAQGMDTTTMEWSDADRKAVAPV